MKSFPPEAISIVPTIIQSTLVVFNTCKELSLALAKDSAFGFLSAVPTFNDLFRLISELAKLSKTLMENKKMFTRLWVHESLRAFYDRLVNDDQRLKMFESVKACVKTIFRENFDSAFEHLGKVNGHVTELNLRNLLFGQFIAEATDPQKTEELFEIQAADSMEKVVTKKLQEYSKSHGEVAVSILPIR